MTKQEYIKQLVKKGEFNPCIYSVGEYLTDLDEETQERIIEGFAKNPGEELRLKLSIAEQKGIITS